MSMLSREGEQTAKKSMQSRTSASRQRNVNAIAQKASRQRKSQCNREQRRTDHAMSMQSRKRQADSGKVNAIACKGEQTSQCQCNRATRRADRGKVQFNISSMHASGRRKWRFVNALRFGELADTSICGGFVNALMLKSRQTHLM